MLKALMLDITLLDERATRQTRSRQFLRSPACTQLILVFLTALLLLGPVIVDHTQGEVLAAHPGRGHFCLWHRVHAGETLNSIAYGYRTNIWTIARANAIHNVNFIYVGQRICIPRTRHGWSGGHRSGVLANGYVRWYAYEALEWSTRGNTAYWIRRAAAYYGLPTRLLMAIAWQESGWYQHVISRDGGVGVMQIMPYTAMTINAATGLRRDPYRTIDNIYLGASFLRSLWNMFGGNLVRVISAYNEGGWAVLHYGIYNWRYVSNVLSLMRRLR